MQLETNRSGARACCPFTRHACGFLCRTRRLPCSICRTCCVGTKAAGGSAIGNLGAGKPRTPSLPWSSAAVASPCRRRQPLPLGGQRLAVLCARGSPGSGDLRLAVVQTPQSDAARAPRIYEHEAHPLPLSLRYRSVKASARRNVRRLAERERAVSAAEEATPAVDCVSSPKAGWASASALACA